MEKILLLIFGIVLLVCYFTDTTQYDINIKAEEMRKKHLPTP